MGSNKHLNAKSLQGQKNFNQWPEKLGIEIGFRFIPEQHRTALESTVLEWIRSQEQLTRRLLVAPDDMQLLPLVLLDKTPVRTLLAEPDALVLDSLSILILAQQFLASVNTDVFWHAHGKVLSNF